MERLLTRTETDTYIIYTAGHTRFRFDKRDASMLQRVFERLASYEDTGLEPEDIKKEFNEEAVLKLAAQVLGTTPDSLRELVKARDAGWVAVLPCKVGDTLYTKSPIRGMVTSFKAPDLAWIIENISEFGKNVFLTRAEAEAALSGGVK